MPVPAAVIENAVAGDGEALRAVREELRVTAAETAFHCEIDSGKLSKFENAVGHLSAAQRERLVDYLHREAKRRHAELGRLVSTWPVAKKVRSESEGRLGN